MQKLIFVVIALGLMVLFEEIFRREPPALSRAGTPPIQRADVPGRKVLLVLGSNESVASTQYKIHVGGEGCLVVRYQCEAAPAPDEIQGMPSGERLLLAPACSRIDGALRLPPYVLEWKVTLQRGDGSRYDRFVHEPAGYQSNEYAALRACGPGYAPE